MLRHNANINFATEAGVTPLMIAAIANDVQIYKMLLDHGANPALIDDDGRNAYLYAVNYQAVDVLIFMWLSGHHFATNCTDKSGNSPLMLWLKAGLYSFDAETAVILFHLLLREEGGRILEWVNVRGESFMSLFAEKTGSIPRILHDAITQSVKKIGSQHATRWLCVVNAPSYALTAISKKIQRVMAKQGLDALKSYSRIEALRIVMALHLRFPAFFKTTFGHQAWVRLMNFYQNNYCRWLMHAICCPPSQGKKANYHHRLVALPTYIINHIYSYLPTLLAVKRLVIPTLCDKVTNQWEALTQGSGVLVYFCRIGSIPLCHRHSPVRSPWMTMRMNKTEVISA